MLSKEYIKVADAHSEYGQAATEFIAMSGVMVTLLLMVPLLGKVADVNHTAIQASRYAAWERTIASETDKSDSVLATEIHNRLLGRLDAKIKTNEGLRKGLENQNPLWRGYGRDTSEPNRLLVADGNSMSLGMRNDAAPGASIAETLADVGSLMDEFIPGADWDLDNDGLYEATVGLNVGANRFLAGDKNCNSQTSKKTFACIERHNVILAESWDSGSPGQVIQRVKAFVPMGAFEKTKGITDKVGERFLFQEWKRFEPGYVAPDVIPSDRLGSYDG